MTQNNETKCVELKMNNERNNKNEAEERNARK